MQDDAVPRNTTIRAFGPLSELIGPGTTLALAFPQSETAIRRALLERWPALEGHRFSIAADATLVREGQTVTSAAELALLPPFAGG
ncbi:MAG: MoaD/ThiS family protein [Spirochaetales bacterium]